MCPMTQTDFKMVRTPMGRLVRVPMKKEPSKLPGNAEIQRLLDENKKLRLEQQRLLEANGRLAEENRDLEGEIGRLAEENGGLDDKSYPSRRALDVAARKIERLHEVIEQLKEEKRRAVDLMNQAKRDKVFFEMNWESEKKATEKIIEDLDYWAGIAHDLQKKLEELERPKKE